MASSLSASLINCFQSISKISMVTLSDCLTVPVLVIHAGD
jgi:hypothetical protein